MAAIGDSLPPNRVKSLRIPASSALKAPPLSTDSTACPSYISLFLTNLRLLNLDLRKDWPGITSITFSTKDAQQNQKKRIQCVEWALYHLFGIWDPEETRNVCMLTRALICIGKWQYADRLNDIETTTILSSSRPTPIPQPARRTLPKSRQCEENRRPRPRHNPPQDDAR